MKLNQIMFLRVITSLLSAGAGFVFVNSLAAESLETELKESTEIKPMPKIAIVGSGIGGSSAAFFIRELVGKSAHIDVFEQSSKVGGRLAVVDYDEHQFEAGGTIIHEANKYMVEFTNTLGLEKFKSAGNGKFGVFNGDEFCFKESPYDFITKLKLIWRYGLFSLWHLDKALTKMIEDFTKIYDLQKKGNFYRTVPDMLLAMGGDDFVNMVNKTAEEVMLEKGIDKKFIHEFVTAITRNNYGQDSMVNGFVGFVSMAGSQPGELFSIKGGNWRVCEKLLEKADATVYLNQPVLGIRKEQQNDSILYYLEKNDHDSSSNTAYNLVIIAAPLEVESFYINCNECQNWPDPKSFGSYQKTLANIVQAHLNLKTFGFEKDNVLTDIFTTENENLRFSSIGALHDTSGCSVQNPPIYKVFSREKLSNETLKEIFDMKNGTKIVSVSWLAYPHYTPPEKFTPFVLDEGVFYVNAIERVASCMEMSAIGGKNAALLAHHYLSKVHL